MVWGLRFWVSSSGLGFGAQGYSTVGIELFSQGSQLNNTNIGPLLRPANILPALGNLDPSG